MEPSPEVGPILKQRRIELGLTIRELARRTGLSASFISQVEREKTKISLDSLRSVSEHLEVTMNYFFSQPTSTPVPNDEELLPEILPNGSNDYSPVVRAGSRARLYFPHSGVHYEMLMKDLNREMEAICGRLSPGTGNVASRLRKPTEEFIYILSGSLLIGLSNKEYILNPGDSIYFDGYDLQTLACASEVEDVSWISIITPPVF